MNESSVLGSGGAAASLRGVAWGGFSRVFLAGIVLVLAAIVVTMSGGAGLGGKLGALFGLHPRQGGKPATAIQVAAPAPVLHPTVVARVTTPVRRAHSVPGARLRSRRPAATGPQRAPAPSVQPVPVPSPAPPPVTAPKPPPPAPSETVRQVAHTVHDTAGPAVPAPAQPVTQPVLDQTVAAVDQACGLIGGCP